MIYKDIMGLFKRLELIGQRFGKLIVIKEAIPPEHVKDKSKSYWHCLCDCGNEKNIVGSDLRSGHTKSCGCNNLEYEDLSGQKFGRLTVIKRVPKPEHIIYDAIYWLAKCDCENEILAPSSSLKNGKIKSCNCLKIESSSHNNIDNVKLSVIKKIFVMSKYNDGNLKLEDLIKLIFQNCYYCGIVPNNSVNIFSQVKNNGKSASDFAVEHGTVIYNGLDRINSNLPHNLDNVVPCCIICNRSKLDRTLSDFNSQIINLKTNDIITVDLMLLIDPKILYQLYPFRQEGGERRFKIDLRRRIIKNGARKRNIDFQLSNEQIINLIMSKCTYCESSYRDGILNGVDRVNNNLGYLPNNSVSCCKWCNSAKSNKTLDEFFSWIEKIKSYQEKFKTIEKLIKNKL